MIRLGRTAGSVHQAVDLTVYRELMHQQENARMTYQNINGSLGNFSSWLLYDSVGRDDVEPTNPPSMSVVVPSGYGYDEQCLDIYTEEDVVLDLSPYAVKIEGNSRWVIVAVRHIDLQEPPIIKDGEETIYYRIGDSTEVVAIPGQEVPSDFMVSPSPEYNGLPVRGEEDYEFRLKKIRLDYGTTVITSDNIYDFSMYDE